MYLYAAGGPREMIAVARELYLRTQKKGAGKQKDGNKHKKQAKIAQFGKPCHAFRSLTRH